MSDVAVGPPSSRPCSWTAPLLAGGLALTGGIAFMAWQGWQGKLQDLRQWGWNSLALSPGLGLLALSCANSSPRVNPDELAPRAEPEPWTLALTRVSERDYHKESIWNVFGTEYSNYQTFQLNCNGGEIAFNATLGHYVGPTISLYNNELNAFGSRLANIQLTEEMARRLPSLPKEVASLPIAFGGIAIFGDSPEPIPGGEWAPPVHLQFGLQSMLTEKLPEARHRMGIKGLAPEEQRKVVGTPAFNLAHTNDGFNLPVRTGFFVAGSPKDAGLEVLQDDPHLDDIPEQRATMPINRLADRYYDIHDPTVTGDDGAASEVAVSTMGTFALDDRPLHAFTSVVIRKDGCAVLTYNIIARRGELTKTVGEALDRANNLHEFVTVLGEVTKSSSDQTFKGALSREVGVLKRIFNIA